MTNDESRCLSFVVAGQRVVAAFQRTDTPWGHALSVVIHGAAGEPEARLSFCCHPEFDGYDDMQSKTTDELVGIVTARVSSGDLDRDITISRESGMTIGFRINSPTTSFRTSLGDDLLPRG